MLEQRRAVDRCEQLFGGVLVAVAEAAHGRVTLVHDGAELAVGIVLIIAVFVAELLETDGVARAAHDANVQDEVVSISRRGCDSKRGVLGRRYDRRACVQAGDEGEDGVIQGGHLEGGDVDGPRDWARGVRGGVVEGLDREPGRVDLEGAEWLDGELAGWDELCAG